MPVLTMKEPTRPSNTALLEVPLAAPQPEADCISGVYNPKKEAFYA